ncbi:MAG TPA: metallophosphoesterase family protein [Candidatus Hydrogenedentes bacterium]|nr:metallophosphoesterase family protein [Candidatus Hydrogenedentota bacterium]
MDAGEQILIQRVGIDLYSRRVDLQLYHANETFGSGRTYFHPENAKILRRMVTIVFKLLGLYSRGLRNACAIEVHEHALTVPNLPSSFKGYRILHLSDLHLDLHPDIAEAIWNHVKPLSYDLCVITGDFCSVTMQDPAIAMGEMRRLVQCIHSPIFAVLGNHDRIEILPELEAMGVRVLMNERVVIGREEKEIYLAGIDDPHLFQTDNIAKAIDGIPRNSATILLAHSAEIFAEANAAGVTVLLCGHTHGGQISLPGGIAILHNASHPRYMNYGSWRYQALRGYTSRGTGSCIAPLRFFAPPEIAVHVLK